VARWGQTDNSAGKAIHHDGWTVVQDEIHHPKSEAGLSLMTADKSRHLDLR
jgi:hypothetical protein